MREGVYISKAKQDGKKPRNLDTVSLNTGHTEESRIAWLFGRLDFCQVNI